MWLQQGAQPLTPSLNQRLSTTLPGCSCVPVWHRGCPNLFSAQGRAVGLSACLHPFPGAEGNGFAQASPLSWPDTQSELTNLCLRWGVQKNGQYMTGRKTSRSCHSWPFLFCSDPFSFVCCTQYNGREHLDSSDSNQICMHIADN